LELPKALFTLQGAFMDLFPYPRPANDTGRGVHWSPAPAKWGRENWPFWRDFLLAANIKWVKVNDDGGGSAKGLVARLANLGIMPVVRLYRQPSYPGFLTSRETDYARALYERYGVVYFETRNEPDLSLEWGGKRPDNWLQQVITFYLDDRDKLAKVGVYALFPAFGPGGEGNPFAILVRRGRLDVFEQMVIALHNYGLGRPLTYPNDGIADLGQPLSQAEWLAAGDGRHEVALNVVWDRWTPERISAARQRLAKPNITIYDDWTCFRAFERMDRLVREACDHSVGMMMTEGGYNVLQRAGASSGDDPRYPKPTPQRTSELTMAMFNYPLPDYMLALMPWLVGVAKFGVQSPGFEHQGPWFTNVYDREWGLKGELPLVQMLKSDPGKIRANGPAPTAMAHFQQAQQFEDRQIDERLKFLEPMVRLEPYQGPGAYWKLIEVQFKEKGNGYIYVRAEDATGTPLEGVAFAGYSQNNQARLASTKGQADQFRGNLPLFGAALGTFRVGIHNQASDILSGVGNGSEAGFQSVDYYLTFRKVGETGEAMLNVPQWRQTILAYYAKESEAYNNATAAGVSVRKVTSDKEQTAGQLWRVIGVRQLTVAESGANQYLYVDLVDSNGQPIRGAAPLIAWTWEGRRANEPAPPLRPDKPAHKAAGNIGLGTGQKITVWVQDGAIPSDGVVNLQAAPAGSSARSFYVLFQRQNVAAPALPPEPGIEVFRKYRISFVFDEEKLAIEEVKITKL
jgi:hypothetical protein